MIETHLKIIGIILLSLGIIHVIFPKHFNWKTELPRLSLVNEEMMKVHTFFIALTVFLMGILCLTSSGELVQTALGKKISLGFSIFWAFRLVIQIWGYSSSLWKGKKLETWVHVVFTLFWIYISSVFTLAYFS